MSPRPWLLAALLLAACEPAHHTATGTVEELRPDLGQIVIAHDDIEGLMPAMTMNFDVAAADLPAGLAPGARVRFLLSVEDGRYRIVAIEQLAGGDAPRSPESGDGGLAAVSDEQDLAPDFALVDQDGRPRSLESLRGKAVLLDFVYTHCPGPCPILTSIHARVQRELPAPLRSEVWFVSISIDPERDTPALLREYGTARGANLASWSFLTGPTEEVDAVLQSYGVGSVLEPDGTLKHVVVTFLIDREGRIAKRYFGLQHETDEYLRDLRGLAG